MQYMATSRGYRHFDVLDEQNTPFGTLDYRIWMQRARITTAAGITYDLTPVGFWQTSISVMQGDVPFATLKRRLAIGIEVQLATGGLYTFKRKSLWQNSYLLENRAEEEVANIQGIFNWRKFNFDYSAEIFRTFADEQAGQLLPMLLVYCIRALAMRQSGMF